MVIAIEQKSVLEDAQSRLKSHYAGTREKLAYDSLDQTRPRNYVDAATISGLAVFDATKATRQEEIREVLKADLPTLITDAIYQGKMLSKAQEQGRH